MDLKNACINLIIDDCLNTDQKDSYIAQLMILGLGHKPLKEWTEDNLVDEVWSLCEYMLDAKENEIFAEDNEKFKAWIIKTATPLKDWASIF